MESGSGCMCFVEHLRKVSEQHYRARNIWYRKLGITVAEQKMEQ